MLTTVAATLANKPPPELPGFLNVVGGQLNHYGYWAVLLLVLIEDFGIPVPGETILIAAAIFAGAGRLNVVTVGIVGFVAAVLGDNIGFAIGHYGGRALALRWGKYIFLTEERLDRAEVFFNAIGAALWVGTWVTIGYTAGSHINTIYHYITTYSYYVLIALAVLVVALILRHILRRRRGAQHRGAGESPEKPEAVASSEIHEESEVTERLGAREGSGIQEGAGIEANAVTQGGAAPQDGAQVQDEPQVQDEAGVQNGAQVQDGGAQVQDGAGIQESAKPKSS